jgi:3-deoxy-7-phosphoheptulonate synthase
MIIQFEEKIEQKQRETILAEVDRIGYKASPVKTQYNDYLICIGNKPFDVRRIGNLPGVRDIHIVSDEYQLVSRKWRVRDSVIDLGDGVQIERGQFSIMSGPCSIEGEEQIKQSIAHLKANDIKIMRGGVHKPRSTPYSFRGLGIEGLKLWHKHASKAGIKIITEVMQVSQIKEMCDYVDIFQVGARNSQNFNLLDALGETNKPVLLKRGMSGTVSELLHSAEYIFKNGNEKILLCERGIRTYEKVYRNTLDLNVVPILKEKSHLPVIVDPSHGIGIRQHVPSMALAAVMSGADGVIVETHSRPEKAYSDGQQNLDYHEAEALYANLRQAFDTYSKLKLA